MATASMHPITPATRIILQQDWLSTIRPCGALVISNSRDMLYELEAAAPETPHNASLCAGHMPTRPLYEL